MVKKNHPVKLNNSRVKITIKKSKKKQKHFSVKFSSVKPKINKSRKSVDSARKAQGGGLTRTGAFFNQRITTAWTRVGQIQKCFRHKLKRILQGKVLQWQHPTAWLPKNNIFSSILAGIIVAGLFSFVIYAFALPYNPGDTTNPTCDPTTTNCTVLPSAVYSFGSNNFLGTGNFTTTGAGSFSSLTLTTTALTIGNGGTGISTEPTAGQLLIGKNDGTYAVAGLTAGANITITNGNGTISIASSGGTAAAGGSSGSVQYNNGGALDGFGSWDGSTLDLGTGAISTTGAIGGGAITGTSFIIGANTISSFANLSSLAGLSWTSGSPLVKMTAAGTFELDANTYLTGNQTITLSGDVSGSGATSIATTLATVGVSKGGTGLTSYTQYGILYAPTTGSLAQLGLGTTTTVLHGNATGAPTFGAVSLTADVTGILGSANGGTGSGFTKFTGPATSEKTFTLPDANATICTTDSVCSGYQAAGTYVTSVSGSSPITSSGGTTPAIGVTASNLLGTTNQVNLSASGTGVLLGSNNITLSLPQDIATSSTPQFAGIKLGSGSYATTLLSGTLSASKTFTFPTDYPASTAFVKMDTSGNLSTDTNTYLTSVTADSPLSGAGTSASHLTIDLSGYVPTTTTVNGYALSGNISVTASDVGLGNVTNESKATMFTSPTFTGTVSGVTAAMVGLGNVENTALSTWTGSSNLYTVKLDGSTLTSSASGLKVTDSTFQPLAGNLTTLAGLSAITNLSGLANLADSSGVLTNNGSGTLSWGSSGMTNPMDAIGQIIYGGASGAPTKLTAGSSGQILQSGGASAPAWTTATYPATVTANQVLFGANTNEVGTSANLTFDTTNGLIVGNTGDATILSSTGKLVLGGTGGSNNESLKFDFETTSNKVAVSSDTGATVLDLGTIALSSGSYVSGTPIITSVVSSGPPGTSPADGAMIVDSGDSGRLYVRYGSAWHYISMTGGFQIPDFETTDAISGEQIKEGDIVLGMINQTLSDNALHGVWVKWDSLKAELIQEIRANGGVAPVGGWASGTQGNIQGVGTTPLINKVTNILSSLGITIKDGIANITNVKIQTADVQNINLQKIQMVDQVTGDIYCTWIANGDWVKVKGECGSIAVAEALGQPSPAEQVTAQAQNVVSQAQQVVQQSKDAVQQAQHAAERATKSAEQAQRAAEQASVDKTDLETAIKTAQEKAETDYTQDSWSVLQAALTSAAVADADTSATQTDVDTATTNLNNAITGLASASEVQSEQQPSEQQYQEESLPSAEMHSGSNDIFQNAGSVLSQSVWGFVRWLFDFSAQKITSISIINRATASITEPFQNLWGFVKGIMHR